MATRMGSAKSVTHSGMGVAVLVGRADGVTEGLAVLLILGVILGVGVMVGAAVVVGTAFGATTPHAKIVSASKTTTRENGFVFESLNISKFLPHCFLLVLKPNYGLYR